MVLPLFAAIRAIAARALRNIRKPRATRRLQLVEVLSLGGKRQIMLVICDGRQFLLGAGPDTVSSIISIQSLSSADAVALLNMEQTSATLSDRSLLR